MDDDLDLLSGEAREENDFVRRGNLLLDLLMLPRSTWSNVLDLLNCWGDRGLTLSAPILLHRRRFLLREGLTLLIEASIVGTTELPDFIKDFERALDLV